MMDIQAIREHFSNRAINAEEGNESALELFIDIKELLDYFTALQKGIKDDALVEAEEWKGQVYHGKMIEVKTGGRWDYSHLDHIQDLKAKIKEMEKDAQAAYKAAEKSRDVITEDGEVVAPAIYKANATSITLSKPRS